MEATAARRSSGDMRAGSSADRLEGVAERATSASPADQSPGGAPSPREIADAAPTGYIPEAAMKWDISVGSQALGCPGRQERVCSSTCLAASQSRLA